MNWKVWKRQPSITPTGRTIDMQKTFWGHNLSFTSTNDKTMKFAIWTPHRPAVGDALTWIAGSDQKVWGRVIKVEPAHNVWDMSFIEVDQIEVED